MKKSDAMANIQTRADAALEAQDARGEQTDLFGGAASAQPQAAQSADIEPAPATRRARSAAEDTRPAKVKPPKEAKPTAAVIPLKAKTKASTAPATKRETKLLAASADIAGVRPDGDDMAFMHTIMCQVGLPRSAVKGTTFERQSGSSGLLVEAGKLWDGQKFVQQPIPYGTTPRLMLAWMNTFAVRHKTQEIPVGDSASDFLRMIGRETTGGRNGSLTMLRKQVQALSACRMTLGFNANGKAYTYDGKPIKRFDAWLHNEDEQRSFWPASVAFSDEYYQTLVTHAVPIDMRALMALKGSSLAMDVYVWLAERLHRINGRPLILHWVNLRAQFGQEYQGKEADKDFRKKFLPALQAALSVYPQAKVKQVTGGL
ncbi:replication protein RepA, partial [Massilia sp. TN1-12]|uniref:replication protein RepA n=1 Tax=Massilia paldalensis TaxID=3377675 RepID=UPI00384F160C